MALTEQTKTDLAVATDMANLSLTIAAANSADGGAEELVRRVIAGAGTMLAMLEANFPVTREELFARTRVAMDAAIEARKEESDGGKQSS